MVERLLLRRMVTTSRPDNNSQAEPKLFLGLPPNRFRMAFLDERIETVPLLFLKRLAITPLSLITPLHPLASPPLLRLSQLRPCLPSPPLLFLDNPHNLPPLLHLPHAEHSAAGTLLHPSNSNNILHNNTHKHHKKPRKKWTLMKTFDGPSSSRLNEESRLRSTSTTPVFFARGSSTSMLLRSLLTHISPRPRRRDLNQFTPPLLLLFPPCERQRVKKLLLLRVQGPPLGP